MYVHISHWGNKNYVQNYVILVREQIFSAFFSYKFDHGVLACCNRMATILHDALGVACHWWLRSCDFYSHDDWLC